jgi:flagellin
MPVAVANAGRIRSNAPAENAYNSLRASSDSIALRQLRLSTGKRINAASDDVAGYITSRSLGSRVTSLRSALNAVGDGKNVTSITQDGLSNISNLLTQVQQSTATASSGALGTDEKVALAQSAYRLVQQIQTVVDSTIFGGRALLAGAYSGDFVIGFQASNAVLTLGIDLTTANSGSNVVDVRAGSNAFAGVTAFSLSSLNDVSSSNLGIFSNTQISVTLQSLSLAADNLSKFASFVGGISNRLDSQQEALQSQITNFNAAISRIEDADVATEQLELIRGQFLQQTSITSLAQSNQNPQNFLQLLR